MRPPLSRLALVELRKMVDTRSGAALVGGTALITVGVMVLASIVVENEETTARELLGMSMIPVSALLPIAVILLWTAEFSQRTALWTFIAVPRRGRVALAKLLAALALGLIATLLTLAVALAASSVTGAGADLGAGEVGQVLLVNELALLSGFAFGMLFGSPAPAIVTYFALPTAFSVLTFAIGALRDIREWLDASLAWEPLYELAVESGDWPQIATSTLLWIGAPVAVGLVALMRREVS